VSHLFSPISSQRTSAFVEIIVSGVLSSWLASETNCFCFSNAFFTGAILTFERYITSAAIRIKLIEPMIIVIL
jgi:hypothetical protein